MYHLFCLTNNHLVPVEQTIQAGKLYSPVLKADCIITADPEAQAAACSERVTAFLVNGEVVGDIANLLHYFFVPGYDLQAGLLSKIVVGADLGGTSTKVGFLRLEAQGGTQPDFRELCWLYWPKSFADEKESELLAFLRKITLLPRPVKALGIALACTTDLTVNKTNGRRERCISPDSSKFGATLATVEQGLLSRLELRWQKELTLPVAILNDGEAAAIAEYRPMATFYRHCLLVTLGTSIGLAFIFHGRLLEGPYSSRASHLILDPHGDWCKKGHNGCWKTLVGREAFDKLAREMGLPPDAIAVAKLAHAGDRDARRCYRIYAQRVAQGIASIVSVVPVEAVIVGGGLAKAGDLLFKPLIERLEQGDLVEKRVLASIQILPAQCREPVALGVQLCAAKLFERSPH